MENKINLKSKFDQNTSFVCVEYPGKVQSVQNMLQTLGGLDNVTKVYRDSTQRLDLRYRPGDPSCKPVCADYVKTTAVLMKVLKYRKKKTEGDNSKPDFRYRQSICGIVKGAYRFKTLCDFQFMSLKRSKVVNSNMINLVPSLCCLQVDFEDKFFKQEASLFLPPPTFSRIDMVQEYNWRKETTSLANKRGNSVIGVSRKSRPHDGICIKFNDDVPSTYLPRAFDAYKKYFGDDKEGYRSKLIQLFSDRPVWSKNAILAKMNLNFVSLKVLLPTVAYYYITGPWRSLWVRYGFDPREAPEAKVYQLLDFRLRQGMNTPFIPVKAKRSTFHYKLPNMSLKWRGSGGGVKTLFNSDGETSKDSSFSELKPNDSVYIYEPGVLPAYRQMFYQACDIKLPEVEQLISRQPPGELKCTEKDGWFVPGTAHEVRNSLSKDIFKTISTMKYGSEGGDADIDIMFARKSKTRASGRNRMMFRSNIDADVSSEAVSDTRTEEEEETWSRSSSTEDEEEEEDVVDEDDLFEEQQSPEEMIIETASLLADISRSSDV
uniref:general transcription factor 3C polypeptide 5-like isoform X2 n=1 Tax=Ciona intestinalis TaxID=7719 RepID=UPI000180C154|nr:general transcription factor 3C polypeptide 5-like isoform X2 [Ciona intestinalis]|eukprot:XP_002130110.1 general transcription factor 3C polypeptide 5-like isoform X2 [Ciona intestinalis]